MAQLREMRQSDPELSLRLAREGNERFPDSSDAAERAAIVVKSLMRMGRADEATDEARIMVEKYAGTTWALDVKRHMLDIPSR
jgi:outer membrane protein assembly factor BamD (BamD/ComL family)